MKKTLYERMKCYESATKSNLTPNLPVIIRLDGVCFHTFTKGLEVPYDDEFRKAMIETSIALAKCIPNCKLAYTQSDEISLLLVDYDKEEKEQWFAGNIQKIVSVSASLAAMIFNESFNNLKQQNSDEFIPKKFAYFDSRVLTLPKEDVPNYFLWRQNDAIKNSITMLALTEFTEKELNGYSQLDRKTALEEKGIYWDFYPKAFKEGTFITRQAYLKNEIERHRWAVDEKSPRMSEKCNEYISQFVDY